MEQTNRPDHRARSGRAWVAPAPKRQGVLAGALVLAAQLLASAPVHAQADGFPNRPITIVVTFAAGSGSDINARFYAKALKETLDANAVVEIKPGAAGMIGAQHAAKAAPDGYTVLMGSGTANAANYPLYRGRIGYKPGDFDTVAAIFASPPVMLTHKALAGDTVVGVLEAAKRSNAKLACGSGNAVTQVACEILRRKTGFDLVNVPYKGNAQSLTDLATGQITVAFADLAAAGPFLANGAIRPVATPTAARLASHSDVKTFGEQGIADFEFMSWNALFVPKGTPRPIIDKLNAAARHMLKMPEVVRYRERTSALPLTSDLAESERFVASEVERWERYVAASGVKPQ